MLNEEEVIPKLNQNNVTRTESNIWYLDNEESKHMTCCRSKFKHLDEGVTRQLRFGDGSTVDIKAKGLS